jgi:hypothetical protein
MSQRSHIERLRMVEKCFVIVGVVLTTTIASAAAKNDEVLTWNGVALRAIRTAAVPGALQPRLQAIVQVAMFDAVNGIERRYSPIHVEPNAERGASVRAAAVYAAYTALVGLFPLQTEALDQDLQASLDEISGGPSQENSASFERGRAWGEHVGLEVLAWRAADGLAPPAADYHGSNVVGKWRPTLPLFALGFAPTLATTLPFIIELPSSFRSLDGPPALTSEAYADSVNEVQSVGAAASVTRTADQTEAARFWGGTASSFWNRAAVTASRARHLTLSQNARLFAVLNIAQADAIISCWDAKYWFELWRPITAIREADSDGNPDTVQDPAWMPLLPTPPYADYDSGHQSISRSSATVLIAYFGDSTPVEGFSEAPLTTTRGWASFTAAADEAFMARIWAGLHFRFAMEDTRTRATHIAQYALDNAAQPLHGH